MPPVIDLIIRLKNGYMAGNDVVFSPYSKFRESALKKIQQLGYIHSYSVEKVDGKKNFSIILQYVNKSPALSDVRIYSKPGRRYYQSAKDIKQVRGGYGYAILSTSKGIMTNIEAKKQNVGGELLFHLW